MVSFLIIILISYILLGANSKPGLITRTEFMQGMKNIRKSSVEDIKKTIATLDPGFLEQSEFRGEIY